ncbi:MAG TPA: ECF transporter S component [Anaerolineales bacterium]|nr:ECF transporter S component [Anaerolineales bacterium]
MDKNSMWKFGTREIVYSAIGAALYGVLNWVFNNLTLPGSTLVSIRPPVAIPMFMGIVFGPLVGLFSGFVGNVIGDLLSGYGFFWAWDLGNGLLGLIPGLLPYVGVNEIKTGRDYLFAVLACVVGALVGIAFPALVADPFILRNIDFNGGLTTEWLPAGVTDAVNGAILTPILLYAWNAYRSRSGR